MPPQARPIFERAIQYVMPEPNSGCWLWTASLDGKGYGQIMASDKKPRRAHKVIYEHVYGEVPGGLDLDHKCRVRCCVNPDHLEPVTRAVNLARGIGTQKTKERAAQRTHCKRGHPKATSWYVSPKGKRSCRICQKIADAARIRGVP